MRKLTHEEFVEKFKLKNTNHNTIVILSNYTKSNERIKCSCSICNYVWSPTPNDLLSNRGCPKCSGHLKRTNDEFISELKQSNPHFNDIKILSDFTRRKDKIKCECKICNYKWDTLAESLLNGIGCPNCGGTRKLSHEEFIDRLCIINSNIEVIGNYVNSATKIKYKCKEDGFIGYSKPNDLLSGKGCPECKRRNHLYNITFDEQTFLNEMNKRNCFYKNGMMSIIGQFYGVKNKIKCHCNKCENEWETTGTSLLLNSFCPNCNSSKLEQLVSEFLSNNNISFKKYFTYLDLLGTGGRLLSYDFYLYDFNELIECQGEQHFNPYRFGGISLKQAQSNFEKQQIHDKLKRNYATKNNIKLIEIPYWDFNNIESILINELELNNNESEDY